MPKRHSEIILSLKRHYSFPNSSEQKFKLHFPITPSATSGQSNSCLISSFQNFSQSFSFAILMSTFHRLSIHTFPLKHWFQNHPRNPPEKPFTQSSLMSKSLLMPHCSLGLLFILANQLPQEICWLLGVLRSKKYCKDY